MKLTRTRIAIALSGAVTLLTVLADPGDSAPETVAPVAKVGAAYRPAHSPRVELAAALPQRSRFGKQRGDPFTPHSWQPPSLPVALPQAAAAPVPPPNPYRFAGTSLHNGALHTFVTDGNRVYEVREGDELNGGYRVDAITPDEIMLVYTPLGSRQAIAAKRAFSAPGDANRVAHAR